MFTLERSDSMAKKKAAARKVTRRAYEYDHHYGLSTTGKPATKKAAASKKAAKRR
jgi:hypothetical protein